MNANIRKHFTVEETDSAFAIMLRVYRKLRVTTHFPPKPMWFPIYTMTLESNNIG